MGRLCCSSSLPYLAVLFLTVLTNSCSAESVSINDGESLMKYLCSPSRTISPNTNLELNKPLFMIDGKHSFCLIENTADITIAPSQQLLKKGHDHVEVECLPGSGGFAFINVSYLTIDSIIFNNCAGVIPAPAVRYVTNYLNDTKTAFIFNHCYNLTLNNLIPHQKWNTSEFSIIGVNLCGHSSVNINIASIIIPYMKTLFYYSDSLMTVPSLKCNLHIVNNSTLEMPPIAESCNVRDLIKHPMWFTLLLSQKKFEVKVNMNMKPTGSLPTWTGPKLVISIMFINSTTDSQVVFQGVPYEFCSNGSSSFQDPKHYFIPLPLCVKHYSAPLFNKTVTGERKSLIIKNTAFALYTHSVPVKFTDSYINTLLHIWSNSRIPHQMTLENTSWCLKYFGLYPSYSNRAGSYGMIYGNRFDIDMVDTYMHYSDPSPILSQPVMGFKNTDITFSGHNYFSVYHGTIMWVKRSNFTISGNLTVRGAGAHGFYRDGAIKLIKSSNLILKEPLEARFYDNRADKGSALFLSKDSGMYIQPNRLYSPKNITEIEIALYFRNNTNHFNTPNSFFIHLESLTESTKFLFYNTHQAYSTVFDIILKEMDEFDKFTSLPYGICWQLHGMKWNCTYSNYYNSPPSLAELYTYPGENAISISHSYDDDFAITQVSCSEIRPGARKLLRDLNYLLRKNENNSTVSAMFNNQEEEEICIIIDCKRHKKYKSKDYILYLRFYVHVNGYCPLGFHISEEGDHCNCTLALRDYGYKCNIDTRAIASPLNFWTGNSSNETILFAKNCPPNHCNPNFQDFIPDDSITDLSCLNSRTGVLCGQCKENYSAVFGSVACYDKCTDLYLLTLPMYILAGLILVVLFFALELTVATGTINGVIFYANILGLTIDKLTEDYHGPYAMFLHIVISLLNLNLGFPLCFYEEMTPTAKRGFQFIFPVYIWSIVIGMIIISKFSIRISNLVSKSSVQVLSTLLYLSYSNLLRTVIDIVSYTTLYSTTDHSNIVHKKTVWFYNGEDYGHGIHGFYLALATIFTALFLLPYTILVTFSYCFMRFKLINKFFKPFIDAYGGPFKVKLRFWFGLRLWITLLLFTVDGILQGKSPKIMLTVQRMIILTFILVQALCCPFQNCLIGLVDLFFMVDYLLIIECYFIFGPTSIAAYILVSLALFVLLLIVLFHCCRNYLKTPKLISNIREMYVNRHERDEEEEADEEADMELFLLAEDREIDTY